MAKLTQAAVKEKLEAWAAVELDLQKAEAAREKAAAPIVERQAQELADATKKYDARISKLRVESVDIEGEIYHWLESQPKAVRLETERAIAELRIESVTKTGPRVVDAQAFIKKAESQKKDPWPCIKVEVGKAEKLLGPKDIDTVSSRKETVTESRAVLVELKD